MIRQLTYKDTDAMVDVIKTQSKLMLSEAAAITEYNFIKDETIFNYHIGFGLYDNDLLDCFVYVNPWEELPAFSWLIFSRKKQEKREKNELGKDKNLSLLMDYTYRYMRDHMKMYLQFEVIAAENWEFIHPNLVRGEATVNTLEIIPPNNMSKYPLIRHKVVHKRYDRALKIIVITAKPEFINDKFNDSTT